MGKIIALLTDFGTKDAYNAVMKGVIKTIAPNTLIVDITHEVQPQNIDEAAYILWNSYKYFPKNTIFVTVVDPGVGSKRKILLVKSKDYIFLAPDNGVLKYIFSSYRALKIYSVESKKYFLKNVSNTFHGRDIFAPVSAYIAKGVSIKNFGSEAKPITKPEKFLYLTKTQSELITGKIIYIDRFGNLISNIMVESYDSVNNIKCVEVGNNRINRIVKFYSQSDDSSLFTLVSSNKLLEVSARNKSASSILNAKIGTIVKVYIR